MSEKKYIIRDKLYAKLLAFVLAILSSAAVFLGSVLAIEIYETNVKSYSSYEEYFSDSFDYIAKDAIYFAYELASSGWDYGFIKNELNYYEISNLELYNLSTREVVLLFSLGEAEASRSFYYYETIDEELELGGIQKGDKIRCELSFASEFEFASEMYFREAVVWLSYKLQNSIYPIIIFSFLLCLICVCFLIYSAGYKKGYSAPQLGGMSKFPIDILLLFGACLVGICLSVIYNVRFSIGFFGMIFYIFSYVSIASFCLYFIMTSVLRIRLKCFFKYTFVAMLVRLVWKLIKCIPLIWKTVLAIAVALMLELLAISFDDYASSLTCWFIFNIIAVPLVIYSALCMKKLKYSAERIAEGDAEHTVDTSKLVLDFKEHGETLNSIRDGISVAVFEKVKSERMKTELITNVSHDIKTPLTSIINYSDLISNESKSCDNEKIKEYSEVLWRQAERLKRLLDDLVEASKASTGNIEVELCEFDLCVLASQIAGEYGDRLERAGLTLVEKVPDGTVKIMADGRRMWRIFDNLFGNAVKYAQMGTRVYLTIEEIGGKAVISLKNTSREELDISPEELMERFTRGDRSRASEGSGLGLSIAKSLCELQGGEIDITVDGDLFKVTLKFDLI